MSIASKVGMVSNSQVVFQCSRLDVCLLCSGHACRPLIHPHRDYDPYQGGYVDFTPWTPEMAANPWQPHRHSIRKDIIFYWRQEWGRTGRCEPMDDPMTASIF